MARNTNDNFRRRAPKPLDDSYGVWDSGANRVYASRQEALDLNPDYRYVSMPMPIMEDGEQVEYWFVGGVTDEHFVRKSGGSVLEFTNGLREKDGVVKLGLDLTTIGTTNAGILTEPTYLVYGDISTEFSSLQILDGIGGKSISLWSESIVNDLRTVLVSDNNSASIAKEIPSQGLIQRIAFEVDQFGDHRITIYDTINNKGLQYQSDNSAIGTLDPRWIPDWGTVKDYVDNNAFDPSTLPGFGLSWNSDTSKIDWGETSPFGSGELHSVQIPLGDAFAVGDVNGTTGGGTFMVSPVGFTMIVGTNNLAMTSAYTTSTGVIEYFADYSSSYTNRSLVDKEYVDNLIPDLTGYATEQWVLDQNYLSSISSSWNINTGDLTIQGNVLNLDGRYMLRSNTITSGYGIVASADFSNPVSIEVDTGVLDNRYLRKDVNDSNSTFNLSLGTLDAGDTLIDGTFTLSSIATGLITDEMVVRDAATGLIKSIAMPNFGGTFTVANNAGTPQFTVAGGDTLRMNATGDASIAFNAGTKTITINSSGGSSGGGVDSWNARTGAVVPEAGDYNTSLVDEDPSALYFTAARVRSTTLTGLSISGSSITATDTVLSALGKAQGQINSLVPESRSITINGTAGNITVSGGTQTLAANRTWTINLANKGTAGTYTKVTTDAQGRVASGGSLTVSDLPQNVIQTLTDNPISSPGYIGITGGNNIRLGSLVVSGSYSDAQSMLDTMNTQSGLVTYSHTTGSTGFASPVGAGLMFWRYSGATSKSGFLIDGTTAANDKLYYANIAGDGVLRSWQTFASESWVLDQIPTIPTNYVTTNTNQTGLSGNKTTSGTWTFSGATSVPVVIERTGQAANSSIQYITTSGSIYAGQGTGNSFGVGSTANLAADAWLNVGPSAMTYASSNTTNVNAPVNGFVFSRTASGGYMGGGGATTTSWTLRNYTNGSGIQLTLNDGGYDAPVSSTVADGPYYAGGNVVLGANNSGGTVVAAQSDTVYLRPNGANSGTNQATFGSSITLSALSGSGTQMVTVNPSGMLGRQAIPDMSGYLPLTGGTLTGNLRINTHLNIGRGTSGYQIEVSGTNYATYNRIDIGRTDGTTPVRINSLAGTGLRMVRVSSTGELSSASIPAVGVTSVTAGNGMNFSTITGSGSVTLGTPGSITLSSTNSVTSTSHTHNFAPGGTTAQYIRGNGTLATFPSIPSVGNGTLTMATGDGLGGSGTFSANQTANTTFTVSLTNIASGSTSIGALRYNGTSKSSGRLYGGSSNPTNVTRLNYDGIIHAYDFVGYGTSDIRLKEQITPISNPLEKLSQIGGYSFKWKDGHDSYSGDDYGVIAQEVEKVLPEIVSERGGVKAIKTGNQLTGLLIAGFNELVKRVEALENGIS